MAPNSTRERPHNTPQTHGRVRVPPTTRVVQRTRIGHHLASSPPSLPSLFPLVFFPGSHPSGARGARQGRCQPPAAPRRPPPQPPPGRAAAAAAAFSTRTAPAYTALLLTAPPRGTPPARGAPPTAEKGPPPTPKGGTGWGLKNGGCRHKAGKGKEGE